MCCLTRPDHSRSCPRVHPGSLCREFASGVRAGSAWSSHREFAPGVNHGSLGWEFVLGVRAGSASWEFVPGGRAGSYTGPSGGSGFVLRFVLFAASVQFYPGGDSVHTGLPVLVSSRAGDCGRLLLLLLCCCLAEFCLCLWCTSRTSPTPPTPLGPVSRTPAHAYPDCKTANDTVTVSSAAEASVHAHAMARVIRDRMPLARAPRESDAFMSIAPVRLVAG